MIAPILAALVLLLSVQTAEAHPHGKNMKRQVNQHQRIKHGMKSGQLTPREAKALRMQQRQIAGMKRVARADGWVSPQERKIINRAQRNANRNIYYKKHNAMHRHH